MWARKETFSGSRERISADRGGDLITRASDPLGSCMGWYFSNPPLGMPSLCSKMEMKVLLISSDFCTNGVIVSPIFAFTVDGYVLFTTEGNASASSFAIFMYSTLSAVPCSSVALDPRDL